MARKNWTKEELILAFNLYLKLPFGKMHRSNPDVIHLAKIMNRTPSSIAMRLTNFAGIDPYHKERGVHGLSGGAKQCQPIWDEYNENREELIFESEKILAEKENLTIETKFSDILTNISDIKGETKLREVKTRVNQDIFRQIVMTNYDGKCAVTGIDIPELLVASHIVPWAENEKERINPENGICLSMMYDKAFDTGFIGINTNYEIIVSSELENKINQAYFDRYFGFLARRKITIPYRFPPKKEFLEYHIDNIFRK
jgi:putative restriction endonuclease